MRHRSMSDLEERGFVSDDRKMGNGAMQGAQAQMPEQAKQRLGPQPSAC